MKQKDIRAEIKQQRDEAMKKIMDMGSIGEARDFLENVVGKELAESWKKTENYRVVTFYESANTSNGVVLYNKNPNIGVDIGDTVLTEPISAEGLSVAVEFAAEYGITGTELIYTEGRSAWRFEVRL